MGQTGQNGYVVPILVRDWFYFMLSITITVPSITITLQIFISITITVILRCYFENTFYFFVLASKYITLLCDVFHVT